MSLCNVGLSDNVISLVMRSIESVSAIITPSLDSVLTCQLMAFVIMKWFCVTRSLYVGADICYRDGFGVNFNTVVVNKSNGWGEVSNERRPVETRLLERNWAARIPYRFKGMRSGRRNI